MTGNPPETTSFSLPLQGISNSVWQEKYAKGDADIPSNYDRVARALADNEADPDLWYPVFYRALESRALVMAGRIMANAGTDVKATWVNCFVNPVADTTRGTDEDGTPGIFPALSEAAESMRRGGGEGYNFSRIRPRGAFVSGTQSEASGPVSYMEVFDAMCNTVQSAGNRRGAQMGMLDIEHPDIEEFICAKDNGDLSNFNISVTVPDAFIRAVADDADWPLVHEVEPDADRKAAGAYYDADWGLWVYKVVKARYLWDLIMTRTYDHGDPGIMFRDRVNAENNLWYCETIEATNPCAEEPLPPYGCCDLAPMILPSFVRRPFTEEATFDWASFARYAQIGVRMLDNVLDLTYMPLDAQRREAMCKRRVGLGYTGLGDALVMLGYRYDTEEAREMAARITRALAYNAYRGSIQLARERGVFPMFEPESYLASGFMQRLTDAFPDLEDPIRRFGVRNSHTTAIAPTGTVSLAFADNASNGVEPPFSWSYRRNVTTSEGDFETYEVEDHAFRLFKARGGNPEALPGHWVTALEIAAEDHMRMVEAVAPWVDSSVSKTVNIPQNYPYEGFKDLYLRAHGSGLKSLATFRPNPKTGVILEAGEDDKGQSDIDESDPDRRIRLPEVPQPPLASLRWHRRPEPEGGNPSWTYWVHRPNGGKYALVVGHFANDKHVPFEAGLFGEPPRGLEALAKSLSMDLRSEDRGWLRTKLASLKDTGGWSFDLPVPPPAGEVVRVPGEVAGFATLLAHHCEQMGVFDEKKDTPLLDARIARKAPRTGAGGTGSWSWHVNNPSTGDQFLLTLTELTLPNGQVRPYEVWLSGEFPTEFNGLAKSLSLDLQILDPAWAAAKLRQLEDYEEPQGDFLAPIPGHPEGKQRNYPSTWAYVAHLIRHRMNQLGILDADGFPAEDWGMVAMEEPKALPAKAGRSGGAVHTGVQCPGCGDDTVMKQDGCSFCTHETCGWHGGCG